MQSEESGPIVEAKNLKKYYGKPDGLFAKGNIVRALDDVSLSVGFSETLGLVGESGSGKSTLGRVILRLTEPDSGSIYYKGREITGLSGKDLRLMRRNMQIIFQDPYSSLDPRMTIEQSLNEPLVINKYMQKNRAEHILGLLDCVGLTKECLKRYPHEFSGGQRQRIVIARALALNPSFIVADEPVSALDVSIQAQILNLLKELQQKLSLSFLFISHDLSVVKYMSRRIAVMFMGHIVEEADAESLCNTPLHPYTKLLLSSVPEMHRDAEADGSVNVLPVSSAAGCVFRARCPQAFDKCASHPPEPGKKDGHIVTCHLYS